MIASVVVVSASPHPSDTTTINVNIGVRRNARTAKRKSVRKSRTIPGRNGGAAGGAGMERSGTCVRVLSRMPAEGKGFICVRAARSRLRSLAQRREKRDHVGHVVVEGDTE